MQKQSVYKDDVIVHIDDDIEKIRTKTGMYISYLGTKGALHLVHELVQNNIDEVMNPESPGTTVSVYFDEARNFLSSADDGRGIAFDQVEIISTKIQSGSKFDRSAFDDSAGENGVGLTAVNALSEMLQYTIYRHVDTNACQKGIFRFNEGKLERSEITDEKGEKHGTTFGFIPSKQILGKCQIDKDALYEWVRDMSYLIPHKYKLELTILPKKKEIEQSWTFKHKNGFADYLEVLTGTLLTQPIYIKTRKDGVDIEMVFSYDPKQTQENVASFANYTKTVDGGVHVKSSRAAISRTLTRLVNDMLSDAEKKKFEIIGEDCWTGLVMAINIGCRRPGFTGQTKEKCGNDELYRPISAGVQGALQAYFKENTRELEKIASYLKTIAKSRIKIATIRKSDVAAFDTFTAATMANFSDANGDTYRELYIGEGLSAKGSIDKAKDPRYQAVLALRGLTANSLKMDPSALMKNAEFATLIKVSGMGIGQYFDLKKSRYKKYIIATDADIDGSNITSSISTFFLTHWRPVVEAGMLYKALTPLYKIKDGKNYRFVVSKAELFNAKLENYVKQVRLRDPETGHKLSKEERHAFFTENKMYPDILQDLYTSFYTHPDIIEFCVYHRNSKKLEAEVNKAFKELTVEDGVIKGSYAGAFQFLPIDDYFDMKTQKLREAIDGNNGGVLYYDYSEDKGETWEKGLSIGQIFSRVRKFDNEIIARWKGLGSIESDTFWETVLDPMRRTLVQLTIGDLEEDVRRMRVLHGDEPKLRRDLLQAYKLDKDDLDT